MIKFNKCTATPTKLDQWIALELNVLLIGEKGVGKTQRVLDAFKRNNLKHAYFSGSTLDPWIHLIGIPKVKGAEGQEKMDFILPSNLDDDIEALFIDEYNRCHKLVKNALLELQQFKSINGRKFPKLKMVWAAINPPRGDDEEGSNYDVEELDPAQLDRFHVIVELPNQPDVRYFTSKYGDYHGKILIDWWKDQSEEAKKILSPRRLDYLGDVFNKGGDLFDLLPVSANAKELISKLSTKKEDIILQAVFSNPTDDLMKSFLSNEQNYLKYKDKINEPRYWRYHKYLKQEHVCANIKGSENYKAYAIFQALKKDNFYMDAVNEVSKSTPNNDLMKIVILLQGQNLDLSKYETSVIAGGGSITTCIGSTVGSDTFSCHASVSALTGKVKKIDLTTFRSIGTNNYVAGLEELVNCWSAVSNHYDVINFTFAMLSSFQAATVAKNKSKLMPLIGTCCIIAKQKLQPDERKVIRQQLHINKNKLEDAYYKEFINYLKEDSTDMEYVAIKDSFLQKVNEAGMMIALMSTIK